MNKNILSVLCAVSVLLAPLMSQANLGDSENSVAQTHKKVMKHGKFKSFTREISDKNHKKSEWVSRQWSGPDHRICKVESRGHRVHELLDSSTFQEYVEGLKKYKLENRKQRGPVEFVSRSGVRFQVTGALQSLTVSAEAKGCKVQK
jgi:hypothetical protein